MEEDGEDGEDGEDSEDSEDGEAEGEQCSICLSELRLDDGDKVAVTACGHAYHVKCWRDWAQHDNDTCPNCRTQLSVTNCVGLSPFRVSDDEEEASPGQAAASEEVHGRVAGPQEASAAGEGVSPEGQSTPAPQAPPEASIERPPLQPRAAAAQLSAPIAPQVTHFPTFDIALHFAFISALTPDNSYEASHLTFLTSQPQPPCRTD